ncbi:hypothetical protein [Streptomyces melanogenes]|uniref:hypothetical protein n=1 Tax=Streptomyces melanogenes TaxID=67326 RepID=UPI00167D3B2C|nr:hypothetical protein [Streptomyces melanogenes]GGP89338.1 hypothetical protein GCM10010278_79730 [Streptomyces melanogenes]
MSAHGFARAESAAGAPLRQGSALRVLGPAETGLVEGARSNSVERKRRLDSDADSVTPLAVGLATAMAVVGGTAFSAIRRKVRRDEAPGC